MTNKAKITEPGLGVGQKLRKAREECGFSQEDVGERLFLNTKIIRALEDDDYSIFASPTYTRGYLRAYAQLVKIPEQEVLENCAKPLSYTANVMPVAEVDAYEERKTVLASKVLRFLSVSIIFALIALVFIWSFNHRANFDTKTDQKAAAAANNSASVSVSEAPLVPPAVNNVPSSEPAKAITPIAVEEINAPNKEPNNEVTNGQDNKTDVESKPTQDAAPAVAKPVDKIEQVESNEQQVAVPHKKKRAKKSSGARESIIVDHSVSADSVTNN